MQHSSATVRHSQQRGAEVHCPDCNGAQFAGDLGKSRRGKNIIQVIENRVDARELIEKSDGDSKEDRQAVFPGKERFRLLGTFQMNGINDLSKRRVAEGRVEARRILLATRKSIDTDADLLEPGERTAIDVAMLALESACNGEDPRKIQNAIDELDRTTKDFAGRRMNRAIASAIAGRKVDDVGDQVEHAKGIERAHEVPDLSTDLRR